MKNNSSKFLPAILFFLLICNLYGQNFISEQLINIPGRNSNFDVITHQYEDLAYICWENENNSTYSIYLKKLHPQIQNEIAIFQDTSQVINPTLTFLPNNEIKIVWQTKNYNHWQLFSRSLIQDSLTEISAISDSLSNNTDPAIYFKKLAWIHDSSLVISSKDSGWSNFEILDTLNCSNPDLIAADNNLFFYVIYEKIESGNSIIKEIGEFAGYPSSHVHADSGINKNPNYGWDLGVSYQKFEDNVWKIVIPGYSNDDWQSINMTFNKENPNFFSFIILMKKEPEDISNCFIVYDSDSLSNNREIYIKLFPNWMYQNSSLINISNLTGDDIKPLATLIDDSVTIFWEHKSSANTSEIWWAKDYFEFPDPTGISNNYPEDIYLIKNYPNPFNPITNIVYHLKRPAFVNLKIFNIVGEEITELTNDFKKSGKHTVVWGGKNSNKIDVSSGVYFYRISVDKKYFYGKMILVR